VRQDSNSTLIASQMRPTVQVVGELLVGPGSLWRSRVIGRAVALIVVE